MNNDETIYISLQEAAQCCNYSQEYLSLRARHGKLRALKFGRNWVTKKEWLEEYLGKVEEYNNNLKVRKFVAPPENLPVEETLKPVSQFWKFQVRFGFIVVLVFVSLITGIFHGRESFKITYETVTPFVVGFSENFEKKVEETVLTIGGAGDKIAGTPTKIIFNTVSEIPQSFRFVVREINSQFLTIGCQTAGIGETVAKNLKGYFQWLGQGYLAANDTLEKNLSQDVDNLVTGIKWLNSQFQKMVLAARDWTWEKWQFVIRPWREVPIVEEPLRPKPEEGAVVVPFPPEAKLAEVKGKLEQAFSDKVEVKPDVTGRAGVIKPLIKEAEAQEYLYLIVPVSEQSE